MIWKKAKDELPPVPLKNGFTMVIVWVDSEFQEGAWNGQIRHSTTDEPQLVVEDHVGNKMYSEYWMIPCNPETQQNINE